MTAEGFATIPRALLYDETLPTDAKMVYLVLSSHVGATEAAWPSHATIAREAGVSVSQVKRMLKTLRDRGLVDWHTELSGAMKSVNRYRLVAGVVTVPARDSSPGAVDSSPGTEATVNRPGIGIAQVEPSSPGAIEREDQEQHSPSGSDAPARVKPTAARRGARLPEDWLRTELDKAWQKREGIPDEFARLVTGEFKNHWASASGRNACKLDWSAAWKKWMSQEWREKGQRWLRDHGQPGAAAVPDFEAQREAARQERARARFADTSTVSSAR